MQVGAHVSVSGGYDKALQYAESVGAECIQFFAKSPRQWRGRSIDPQLAEAFVLDRERRGFGPVFTHTAYLINLGATDPELREKSIAALADELVRGALLEVDGTVTHVGNDPGGDPVAAAARIGTGVRQAFERAGDAGSRARLLLENAAGAGRTFGVDFAELGACIDAAGLPVERLGVCLDTCHAFASGMALDTAEGWTAVIDEIGRRCMLERLGLVHANDCMFERGSRRDRHAWIGDGFIGATGFSAMMCSRELRDVPACLEMPGEVPEKDALNIERLKSLRESCG
jgi:deoxyribonuclease-4